jgi:RNA polymerase sigma factor (sigma-70 family)
VNADDTLGEGEVFYDMTSVAGEIALDGLKVDQRGNVYVSGPGGIWLLSPQAKHIGTIQAPELPANFASSTRAAPGYELLESAEIRAMVRRAIERLPDAYREVLILRDIEELDTEETAELLDASPNAIKVRLHRARQALRTLLEGSSPSKPPAPAFQITDETADRG